MKLSHLLDLVGQGESEKLEFKRTTGQRTDAVKTVCAMLNGLGGFVLFGVTDDGHIGGQQITSRTLDDVAAELGRIERPAFLDMETVNLENGNAVLVLRVSGGGGPYTYDGRPFVRQGAVTRRMPQKRYEQLLLEGMHASNRWENQEARDISIGDLDSVEVVRTVDEAIRRQRIEDPGTRDPMELLRGLGLLNDNTILNAAVVLFIRQESILPNYPQCQLKLARFRGIDKTEFIDNRQEYGNAFELLQRAQRFLRDHLPVAGRILPNLFERVDDPLYPPAALREAIANAICHRDYSITGGSVSIAIFDDRLEISSSGILPFDLTPEDLTRPHASRPWNPLIAQTFYRRGIIETWGRGTIKIRELTSAAGLVAPEFDCQAGEVIVRFRSGRLKSRLESQLDSQLESHDLPLAKKILQALAEGSLSKSEISVKLGQKQASGQLHRVIRELLDTGKIEMTIPAKPQSRLQRYRLKSDAHPIN